MRWLPLKYFQVSELCGPDVVVCVEQLIILTVHSHLKILDTQFVSVTHDHNTFQTMKFTGKSYQFQARH